VLRINQWRHALKTILTCQLAIALVFGAIGCSDRANPPDAGTFTGSPKLETKIVEVSPPATLTELHQALEIHRPQVSIVSPHADETIEADSVTVQLQIQDFPLFKNEALGAGPHIDLLLDNQPPREIYDLSQPLVLENLSPGTHTLRAFAVTPWHESFKNEGAYAQTTFHLYTPTDDNHPDPALPLLTYSQPQGSYGAEPILLDFYLTNAPLHLVAQESDEDAIADWRIRCTINGKSFVTDRWQPIYLQGFRPGKNWVKLEFLDEQGNPVKNAFNSTVRVVDYQPGSTDTLARLVRGEILGNEALSLVDASYIQPEEPEPVVEEEVEPEVEELPPSETVEERLPESDVTEETSTEADFEESAPEELAPEEDTSEEEVGESPEAAIEQTAEDTAEETLNSTEIELDESAPAAEETPIVVDENPTPETQSLTSEPEATIDGSEPVDLSVDTPADTSIDMDAIEAVEEPVVEASTPIEELVMGSAPESEPANLPAETETVIPEAESAIEVSPIAEAEIEETLAEETLAEETPSAESPVVEAEDVSPVPEAAPSVEAVEPVEAATESEPGSIESSQPASGSQNEPPIPSEPTPSEQEDVPFVDRINTLWQAIRAQVGKLLQK
jgi:hypothetical protein